MLASAREVGSAVPDGRTQVVDGVVIELGRSCERLFRLDGGCYLSSLGITDLLVVLPSGLDLSELLRREAFEDDACSAGERRFRGLQLRRSY